MDIRKRCLTFLVLMYSCQSFSQSFEVITNGVAAFNASKATVEDTRIFRFEIILRPEYYDWNASDEEVATGLWIAKLFSRYKLSVSVENGNGVPIIKSPNNFATYPSPDFSVHGIAYTDFHIRIIPFYVRYASSTNDLKCLLASFYVKCSDRIKYVYSVYVNLNTGTGNLNLESGISMIGPTYFLLPLLSSEELNKQELFIRQRNAPLKKPHVPHQLDDEIEIQVDL